MLRPVAACALPALAIAFGWASIEQPRQGREALLVAVLALTPALLPRKWQRVVAAVGAAVAAAWVAFGIQAWELLPFRDERVVSPVAGMVDQGIADFYRVLLPFAPEQNPEMHALVLVAVFAFVLAAALLVASGRPLGGAAVTVAGAGWPATPWRRRDHRRRRTRARGGALDPARPSRPHGAGARGRRGGGGPGRRRRRVGLDRHSRREERGAQLGELGLHGPSGADDLRQVRLGLELRRHPLPALEDGRDDGRRPQ